jgi:arylsulfatase A-like enzyme
MRPSAAGEGARAFLIYAIIETAFVVVFRWVFEPHATYRPHDTLFVLGVFVFYALIGAGIGTLVGFVAGDVAARAISCAVILTAGALTYLFGDGEFSDILYSLFLLAIAVAMLLVLFTGQPRAVEFLTGRGASWITGVVLILPSTTSRYAADMRVATLILIVSGMFALSWWIQRRRRWHHVETGQARRPLLSPRQSATSLIGTAAALSLASWMLQPTLWATTTFSSRPTNDARPNVVLITLDTVATAHLSLYGYARDTTPNLSRLGTVATVFRNAQATSNYTLPTQASMLTGMYPHTHGAKYWDSFGGDAPLGTAPPVMPELLGDEGYATAAVVANTLFLTPEYGLQRGFAHYDARTPSVMLPRLLPRFSLRRLLHQAADVTPRLAALTGEFRTGAEINAAAFALLDDPAFRAGPFFLFVNYMDAHAPYLPPAPFATRFTSAPLASSSMDAYDAALASLDARIADVVARLTALGVYDNTLLILVGDHGEGFGEHGDVEHPSSLYANQIRVPLIIKWPHQTTGAVVDDLVSDVDMLPTVMAALGRSLPPRLPGRNLAERGDPTRAVFAEDYYGNTRTTAGGVPSQAMMAGPLKLIRYDDGRTEVFDVAADPGETRNIYRAGDPAQAAMAQALERWRLSGAARPPEGEPNRTAIERLRSLGYLR